MTFDWPGLMRAGMLGLKLTPAQFWALTPAELLLMLGLDAARPPMAQFTASRRPLEHLARNWMALPCDQAVHGKHEVPDAIQHHDNDD